ncbi:MAG: YtxH domain-containing protein [Bacteroidales bacterium]|nr:YtxH domain-containing protein [Bacteroidales bacterium]
MAKNNSGKILFLGVAIGVAIGLLLAPKSGSKTRKQLKKRFKKVSEDFQEEFSDEIDKIKTALHLNEDEDPVKPARKKSPKQKS